MGEWVKLREVAPRDGLQNEPGVLATADKVALIEALARTGVERMELTSFVRPDVVAQLADAEAVLAALQLGPTVARSVLVPNLRGLERALTHREAFDEVSVFLSASEAHSQANVNASIETTLARVDPTLRRARAEGLRCEGVISVAFGCPFEGEVPLERVLGLARALVDSGAQEIALGDTTGMANPVSVRDRFAALRDALDAEIELTAHFHNTRGQGLANVSAALDVGVRSFETSVGELGGCPFPPGATGNVATEDVVSMVTEMGFATSIDLDALLDAARLAEQLLGRRLGSHVLTAGRIDWRRS